MLKCYEVLIVLRSQKVLCTHHFLMKSWKKNQASEVIFWILPLFTLSYFMDLIVKCCKNGNMEYNQVFRFCVLVKFEDIITEVVHNAYFWKWSLLCFQPDLSWNIVSISWALIFIHPTWNVCTSPTCAPGRDFFLFLSPLKACVCMCVCGLSKPVRGSEQWRRRGRGAGGKQRSEITSLYKHLATAHIDTHS